MMKERNNMSVTEQKSGLNLGFIGSLTEAGSAQMLGCDDDGCDCDCVDCIDCVCDHGPCDCDL